MPQFCPERSDPLPARLRTSKRYVPVSPKLCPRGDSAPGLSSPQGTCTASKPESRTHISSGTRHWSGRKGGWDPEWTQDSGWTQGAVV